MKEFVHLHLHTQYSLLDGITRIDKLFDYCKQLNMPAVAITDHGNMYGVYSFYNEAKKNGIKPIIGCEFYTTENLTARGKESVEYSHLILIAKNDIGYKNLMKLNSISFIDGFYYKPRIDFETLKKHHEGLICLSACIAGELPRLILANRREDAEVLALKYKKLFGEDYYIELQDHGISEQKYVNPQLVEIAKKLKIQLVATNDVHYLTREDSEVQDVLMCIQMQKHVDDTNRLKFSSDNFYLKSGDEMQEIFSYAPEAISNTLAIADKCDVSITPKKLLPAYVPKTGQTPEDYLWSVLSDGLKKRYEKITPEIKERAKYEFDVITDMGYTEYFLIVWDFIAYARSKGISVGPGRGSGAGSIVAYSIGITDIDPLKFDLIFERFLNKDRTSMPDFDIDFQDDRRDEVISYVIEKYGESRVAQIITFGTLAAKAAIKDVGRVLRVPYGNLDKVTKIIPFGKVSLTKIFGLEKDINGMDYPDKIEELAHLYENDLQIQKVIDLAIKIEGMPRNASTHAAGVVICREDIADNVPLQRNGDEITTQFTKLEVEALGLLKMDFLGLRTLTDISKAIDLIKKSTGKDVGFAKCTYDDPEVFKLIGSGDTDAVFQLESPGMKRVMKNLQPTSLEDITAGISLYRPGPMQFVPNYIAGKKNANNVRYKHPMLEDVLKNTYGCIVYQEQVMQIARVLGGFSYGQADVIRDAMSKKKSALMEKNRKYFIDGDEKLQIDGAVKRGIPKETANDIFNDMSVFSEYAFNKSHAAAYAVLSYQTAYLKTYYPIEFLAAVLNNRIQRSDEIAKYVNYCLDRGIEVLPPDINKSFDEFSVDNGKIRFGLAAIKNISSSSINIIIEEREKAGKFASLQNMLSRVKAGTLNKRGVESLIFAGVFDSLKARRSQLIAIYEQVMDVCAKEQKAKDDGQISIFETLLQGAPKIDMPLPDISEYGLKYKLTLEKEVLGMYVTGHPLDEYAQKMKSFSFNTSTIKDFYENDDESSGVNFDEEVLRALHNKKVTAGGMLSGIKKLFTNKGNLPMAFAVLEDMQGVIELLIPPKNYNECKDKLDEDALVSIEGALSVKAGDTPKIIVDKLDVWLDNDHEKAEKKTLYLKLEKKDDVLFDSIQDVLSAYLGDIPVRIAIGDEKKCSELEIKVRDCPAVKYELEDMLGAENVKMIVK